MQAVLKMIRFMLMLAYRGAIAYVIFMLVAWVLLGMHPKENWAITTDRISGGWNKIMGFADDTKVAAKGLHQLGEKHLNEAKDRYHGIDPYENYNNQLSQEAQGAVNQ